MKKAEVGKMENLYYCPNCNSKLEKIAGCGSISYFCNECKLIISKKRILTEEQLIEKVSSKVVGDLKNKESEK